jgi:hypothetical protein
MFSQVWTEVQFTKLFSNKNLTAKAHHWADTNDTGPGVDYGSGTEITSGMSPDTTGGPVNSAAAIRDNSSLARIGNRRKVRVPGRLTWRDASGTLRFVSVITRDVSDVDAFVECQVPASIPLYRLVHFQIERPSREAGELPTVLQGGKVLSAIYRVGPYKTSTGTPQGYALRLLVDPVRAAATSDAVTSMAVAN